MIEDSRQLKTANLSPAGRILGKNLLLGHVHKYFIKTAVEILRGRSMSHCNKNSQRGTLLKSTITENFKILIRLANRMCWDFNTYNVL